MNGAKKLGKTIVVIFVALLIVKVVFSIKGCNEEKKLEKAHLKQLEQTRKARTEKQHHAFEIDFLNRTLIEEHWLEPGEIWEGPYINYKFAIEAKDHSFAVKYEGLDEWVVTKKGDNLHTPEGATAGKIKIKSLEKEGYKISVFRLG